MFVTFINNTNAAHIVAAATMRMVAWERHLLLLGSLVGFVVEVAVMAVLAMIAYVVVGLIVIAPLWLYMEWSDSQQRKARSQNSASPYRQIDARSDQYVDDARDLILGR